MQQNTCTPVCWSTSCNIWHPSKDLGSCYCDTHPPMEQLSSMHQQWFHILLHMQRHLRECSVKAADTVPSGTTATPQALSSHCFLVAQPASPPPAPCMQSHICCTCNTGNPDETGSSCSHHTSCSEECPSTKVCDIPCHTCAAMKIWPCPHGTKMPDPGDLGTDWPRLSMDFDRNALPSTSPINHV